MTFLPQLVSLNDLRSSDSLLSSFTQWQLLKSESWACCTTAVEEEDWHNTLHRGLD